MALLPRDIRDVRRMTKSELLTIERKINKSIDNIYDRGFKDDVYINYESGLQKKHSNKPISIESVVTAFVQDKNRIKRYIYDCDYCADAKFTIKTDKKTGEDVDYYKSDCGQAQCMYQDAIEKDISSPKEDIFKKLLID